MAAIAGALGYILVQAVDSLGQQTSHRRLARPSRASKQISVCDPPRSKSILERLCDVLLTDNILETLWSPLEVQSQRSHLDLLAIA
jgi:hypothetical protein